MREFLVRESLLITIAAVLVCLWSLRAHLIQADSWLTLAAGDEIVTHGIPHRDHLAVISQGHEWVDQQWLSHVVFWALHTVGGIRLVGLSAILLLVLPVVGAIVFARRRGASPAAIGWLVAFSAGSFTSFVRAQLLSQVLFVAVLAVLAAESRRPTRSVYLLFPALVLWANLHGAVLVGAGLVALLGLYELGQTFVRRAGRAAWLRPLALVGLPWPCLLATPYGTSVIGYFHSTIGNSDLHETSVEWMAPTFASLSGFPFFVLALGAVALVAKHPRDLTGFEIGALALTLVAALIASRSVVWFTYTSLMLLPPLLNRLRRGNRAQAPMLFRMALPSLALLAAGGTLLLVGLDGRRLTGAWPAPATAAVSRVLVSDPKARVFASYEYGDWLLFEVPSSRGRIAFDGRWELLTGAQIHVILNSLWQLGSDATRAIDGYRLVVLNPQNANEQQLIRSYASAGIPVLYGDSHVIVYDRGTEADAAA